MSQLMSQILEDVKTAMKSGAKTKLEALRTLHADIKKIAIDGKKDITDEIVIDVLAKTIKQKREAIEQFKAGHRQDLVDAELERIAWYEAYLPKALTDAEVEAIVRAAITEAGAASPADMGKVMKIVQPQTKGRADGKAVSSLVQKLLAGG